MSAVVRAAVLKNYLEVAKTLGLNGPEMLRSVGLSLAMLKDAESMIPFDSTLHLLENSALRSGCETFGLQMAQMRELSDFGVVSLLLSHQRTLRDVLTTTIEYRYLINRTLAMNLEDFGRIVIVREEVMAPPGLPKRQATELAIGILHRMCASLMGPRWNPRSVNFAHPAPADRKLHEQVFRTKLLFDEEFSGIVCQAADLDAPNPKADPAMASYARRFMDTMAGDDEKSTVFDVRKAIYLLMPVGRATVEQCAQGLGVSVRTLQRQLDEAETSFSELLNSVRCELAPRYMENRKYSLQRVGMLLGYGMPSSFTRWFAAQYGMPPRKWRSERGIAVG